MGEFTDAPLSLIPHPEPDQTPGRSERRNRRLPMTGMIRQFGEPVREDAP
jgi:hypothetical protein